MRLLAVTLFATAFASAAVAQTKPPSNSPTMQDARCLLAMVALSNAKDPNAQRLGQGGIVYFTGRITAREPNFDFGRLKSMAATLDLKAAQADLQQRCAPMFQKSIQQLEASLAPPAGATPPASPPKP